MIALTDDILDLLTAYVLGALEPDEIVQVSALLARHPELRATLVELRATADRLPYGLPEAAPAADLRQRVLDRATGRASATPPPALAGAIGRTRAWIWSFGAVAALAILLAAFGWGQLFSTRNQLAQAQAQIAGAQGQLAEMQSQIAAATRVIASLEGQTGIAAIVETRAGAALLVAQLPPLQPGRVYQIWRIQAQSAPASAGLFTVGPQGYGNAALLAGQQPQSGETIAVTDEPAGGSSGPTTVPLVVGRSA